MFCRHVDTVSGWSEEAAHGGGKDDLAGFAGIDPFGDELLGEFERGEYICLEVPSYQLERNFEDRAAFAYAGIAEKHIDIVLQRESDIEFVEDIQFYHLQVLLQSE